MTVETEHRRIQHAGDDGIRTYYYDFEVPEEEYLFVLMDSALVTSYTVSGIGEQNGGSITFNDGFSISGTLTLYREVDLVQETDLVEGGLFRAETIEDTEDYHRFVDQQLKESIDRCIRLGIGDENADANLIIPDPRDATFIRFDEDSDLTLVNDGDLNLYHNHDDRYSLCPHGNECHSVVYATTDDVTFENLLANSDVGVGGDQVAYGNHNHDGVYMKEDHDHDNQYSPLLHGNENHTSVFITTADVTYETLSTNSDVGTAATQVAQGDHTHDLNDMPTEDGEWFGQGVVAVVGELVSAGDVLTVDGSSEFVKADADDNLKMPASAIALEDGSGSGKGVLLQGVLKIDSWSWTPGWVLFVSTTKGNLTHTYPTGASTLVQPVGVALSSNIIFFNPNYIMLQRQN